MALALIAWLYFNNRNNALKKAHRELVGYYQECIVLHRNAFAAREKRLKRYSFIRYNLRESLIDQIKATV
ncbi:MULTISPECIES: hypothetical protein [unclassified Arenibacter]|uniref:hypothetical protein n=1 Tax=unclassified Arenibacter TaxID=2615047 RepID=UPI000E3445D4|nr:MULTISPECIES: hypothetical protein [unclassified Arenibacter]MCM4163571.1 hypothetical protein [Arenibacter sp. A80]RFT56302.1 hypothetical protein D0S24_08155 [Arenibacter sp. P308M17]